MDSLRKKGVLAEGIVIIIIIFVFVILTFLGLKMVNSFNEYAGPTLGASSANATYVLNKGIGVYGIFDTVFVILIIGLVLTTGISMFFIRTHPVFFIISILGLGIVITFAVVISNAYEEVITNTDLHNETTFTVIPHVMNNLPVFIAVLIILLSVILYAKSRGGQEFI
jgi:hypothetical protein